MSSDELQGPFVNDPAGLRIAKKRYADRIYAAANREAARQKAAAWYWANRARAREAQADYRRGADREQLRSYARKWARANPDVLRLHKAARRARVASALHPEYSPAAVKVVFDWSRRLTRCLGIKFHVDHVLPLSRGGTHHHTNLRPIPAHWNFTKNSDNTHLIPECWVSRTIET